MSSFAIVLICFKRLNGIKRLLSSLEKVDYRNRKDITLIFSIDYADNNEDVRNFAYNYQWTNGEKVVRAFTENQGLKKHILDCGDLTQKYDILVVLEDDIYVSPSMYHYAYGAACYYINDNNIAGISLYNFDKNWLNTMYNFNPQKSEYDTYFLKVAQSWGQVWTRDKWLGFKEWYIANTEFTYLETLPQAINAWSSKSSWLKYYDRYCIECNKYFVYPYFSVSTNFSDAGTHSLSASNDSQVRMVWKKNEFKFPCFGEDAIIYDEFMERERMGKYLNIKDEELIVDIYANKPESIKKKYVLTTRKLNYFVVSSFSLCLKPAELSIVCSIWGEDIFLYDTSIKEKNYRKKDKYKLLRYSLGIGAYGKIISLLHYAIKELIFMIMLKFKNTVMTDD